MDLKSTSSKKNTALSKVKKLFYSYRGTFTFFLLLIAIIILTFNKAAIDARIQTQTSNTHISKESTIKENSKIEDMQDQYSFLLKGKPLKSSKFRIYIHETDKGGEIVYIKKKTPDDSLLHYRFFIHIYPKNRALLSQLSQKDGFINIGFDSNVKEYQWKDNIYYATRYDIPFVPVDKIVTGQYMGGFRAWTATIDSLPYNYGKLDIENLEIGIKEKHFRKLEQKRLDALKVGILISSDDDYVPAQIKYKDKVFDAELRLKGDWTDHLQGKKWSFRIKLKGENTLFGMKKFSIHHPKTRNYLYEWAYLKTLKREGLIGLRYDFVNVSLQKVSKDGQNGKKDLGIYALEEAFGKRLIENNRRREGVILKISEDYMWKEFVKAAETGNRPGTANMEFANPDVAKIEIFGQKGVLENPSLEKQFNIARNLLAGYRNGEFKVRQVFDIERIAKYNALSDLFGAHHGITWHNLRFYYNPVTSLMETIGFDGDAGKKIFNLKHFYNTENDHEYLVAYARALEEVSQRPYLEDIIDWIKPALNKKQKLLQTEFPIVKFDVETFYFNQKVIRKQLDPATALKIHLKHLSDDQMILNLKSFSAFPIEVINISHNGKREIAKPATEEVILHPEKELNVSFHLPGSFNNLFVSKKTKQAGFYFPKHIKEIVLTYRIMGTSILRTSEIIPYTERDADFATNDLIRQTPNIKEISWVFIDEKKKVITFQSGLRVLRKNLIIPPGYIVKANRGFHLELTNNAKIISYSPLHFVGSKENPINIYAKNKRGQGLLVMNAKEKSVLKYVFFKGLGAPTHQNWSVTGAVTFYESPVEAVSVYFRSNYSEDALNIVRSDFSIRDAVFEDTFSDAFDGDFVVGNIENSVFKNLGNDAIDVSGSTMKVSEVNIFAAGDKGLSAGENSQVEAMNISIYDSEIAVASKDLSHVIIDNLQIENCKLGFTAFKKKPEFGVASIEATNVIAKNVETMHLIESLSKLIFNGEQAGTIERVKDKMYGVEFGKSSK